MSCWMNSGTGELIPIIYTEYTNGIQEDDCVEYCYTKGNLYFVFYQNKYCGCAVIASSVDANCTSCPSQPHEGSTYCDRSYVPGVERENIKLALNEVKVYSTHENALFNISNSFDFDKYQWNFGDGSEVHIATNKDLVSHLYKLAGVYKVSITATKGMGEKDMQISILVEDPPITSEIAAPIIADDTKIVAINMSLSLGSKVKIDWTMTNMQNGNSFTGK